MEACKKLCAMQRELAAKVNKAKTEVPLHHVHAEILEVIRQRFNATLRAGLQDPDKSSREAGLTLLINQVVEELKGEYPGQHPRHQRKPPTRPSKTSFAT